jgi:hypothetical protein
VIDVHRSEFDVRRIVVAWSFTDQEAPVSHAAEVGQPGLDEAIKRSRAVTTALTSEDEDMFDTPEDLIRWPALADRLRDCGELITPVFRDRDSEAKRHQKYHRWLTKMAAFSGTGAVLFAILQLAYPDVLGGFALAVVEVVAVFAALAAVAMGLSSGRQSGWLLQRHKAERLRLAKFRFLIDPTTWSDAPDLVGRRVDALRQEVNRILAVTRREFREWTEVEDVRPEPLLPRDHPSGATRDQLLNYYRINRLCFQRDVFRLRATRHDRWDRDSRRLGPILFLGSVIAALAHFGVDLVHSGEGLHAVSTQLIFVAAALPVAGACIRTLRTASEFARNTSRYRAKAVALDRLEHLLENEKDAPSKMRLLWYSEELLEFEHHEWCRLMIEAEWLP